MLGPDCWEPTSNLLGSAGFPASRLGTKTPEEEGRRETPHPLFLEGR